MSVWSFNHSKSLKAFISCPFWYLASAFCKCSSKACDRSSLFGVLKSGLKDVSLLTAERVEFSSELICSSEVICGNKCFCWRLLLVETERTSDASISVMADRVCPPQTGFFTLLISGNDATFRCQHTWGYLSLVVLSKVHKLHFSGLKVGWSFSHFGKTQASLASTSEKLSVFAESGRRIITKGFELLPVGKSLT